jgi:hypothetical protein
MLKCPLLLVSVFLLYSQTCAAQASGYASSFRLTDIPASSLAWSSPELTTSHLQLQPLYADRKAKAQPLTTAGEVMLVVGGLTALSGFLLWSNEPSRDRAETMQGIGGLVAAGGLFMTILGIAVTPKKHAGPKAP